MYFILIDKPLCQDMDNTLYQYHIGVSPLKGFLLPHSDDVAHLTYGRPSGVELNLNRLSHGDKGWHHRFNMPERGLSITYFNTDMKETGHWLSAIVYMKFPLIRTSIGCFIFHAGTGLTYSTKIYDREDNNLNNAISSKLTYNMQGRFGFQFDVSSRWLIYPSFTLTHASNGSFKLPNAGLNIISANLGIGYRIAEIEEKPLPGEEKPLVKNMKLNILLSGAAKEIYPTGGQKYGYWTFRAYTDKTLSRVSKVLVGGEVINNRSLRRKIQRNDSLSNRTDHKRASLLIGHELTISRVSVMTQFAYYVHRPYKDDFDPNFYQRYGIKYYFTDKLFGTAMLKTFLGRADTFDFGLGIRL